VEAVPRHAHRHAALGDPTTLATVGEWRRRMTGLEAA
jgi:hypothetical protein